MSDTNIYNDVLSRLHFEHHPMLDAPDDAATNDEQ